MYLRFAAVKYNYDEDDFVFKVNKQSFLNNLYICKNYDHVRRF